MANNNNNMFKIMNFMLGLLLVLNNHKVINANKLSTIKQATKKDGSLSLLVIGDWGRKGAFNQTLVATQIGGEMAPGDAYISPATRRGHRYVTRRSDVDPMGIVGEKLDVDFIISTGDNFYDDGLTGIHDPNFEDSFSTIYTSHSLQKRWYNVLGNHDYRGDVLAQLSPELRIKDNRWLCMRSYIVNTDIVDFFFVDTTPFQDKYFSEQGHTYDWRSVLPRQQYISNLLKKVDEALKKSNAKWKFVIGHHPILSAGHHGNTEELVVQLLPILKKNNVDLYINGHDHCLEHISSPDSSLQFLTSGGGSKAWRGDVKQWNPEQLKLYYDGQGFMSIQVTQSQVDIMFYDILGNILHKWSKSKPNYYTY